MAVSVSGPVLSALLYEHANCIGDQEGFLLGQTVSHVTDTISDSQLNNRKEEVVIYVYNYVACSRPFLWYDHAGRVNTDKLKTVLRGHKQQEVIGWYKWRRQSTLTPTMREKAIHKSLLDVLPGVDCKHFLFSLFSLSESSNLAKHTFEHIFHVQDGRTFHGLPLTVVNLKDTSQADYKTQASRTIHPREGFYAQTLLAFRPEFVDTGSERLHQVQSIHSLNSQLHQQLMSLYESVSASEESVNRLSSEVETLRERWKRKRYPPLTNKVEPGRLHASRSDSAKPEAAIHSPATPRATSNPPQPMSSPSPPRPPHSSNIQPASPPPPSPSLITSPHSPATPSQPLLQHQRSNQEQISEELRDLFLAPPVIVPCNQSGLVTAGDGRSLGKIEVIPPRPNPPHGETDPPLSPTDDDFITETLQSSPSLKRKTRQTKMAAAALNNAEPPADVPAATKKKDAFSFVENMLQDVKSSGGIKNIPGKKEMNKPVNDLMPTGSARHAKVQNRSPSPAVKKINNADVISSVEESFDDEDELSPSPTF